MLLVCLGVRHRSLANGADGLETSRCSLGIVMLRVASRFFQLGSFFGCLLLGLDLLLASSHFLDRELHSVSDSYQGDRVANVQK